MKVQVKSAIGIKKSEIELPLQFKEEIRPDLIKRAVLVVQSNKKQPYGTDPEAGKKYSSKLSRRRRDYKGAYGIGISRVPRKIMSHTGTRFNWVGATAPNTRGGMQPHPPKSEKIFSRKINKKERRKAIRSAMSASVIKELVMQRGHLPREYPLIVDTEAEKLSKTKDVLTMFEKLGLCKELERASRKTPKTGKAKRRGRTHKSAVGPLIVVSEKCPKCAYPLNPKNSITQVKNDSKPEVIVKPKEGCFLQTLNFGCALIAIIIGMILTMSSVLIFYGIGWLPLSPLSIGFIIFLLALSIISHIKSGGVE